MKQNNKPEAKENTTESRQMRHNRILLLKARALQEQRKKNKE